MRILIVLDHFTLGGIQTHAINLAEYLMAKGMNVEFLSMQKDGNSLCAVMEEHNISFHNLQVFRNINSKWKTYIDYIRLIFFLKKRSYDVIIPFHPSSCELFTAIHKLGNSKVCFIQEMGGSYTSPSKLNFLQITAKKRDPIYVANSTHGVNCLKQRMHLDNEKVHVIHNGLKIKSAEKEEDVWRKELGISKHSKVCLMLGNYFAEKDHLTLIKAWQYLVKECGLDDGYLLFAGADPSPREEKIGELKAYCQTNHLRQNVYFLGAVKDNIGLIEASDIGVLSSKSEGLPNSVLEFMALNKPFVGTNIPGIVEAVGEDYKYLFEVGDYKTCALHIQNLLFNPNGNSKPIRELNERFKTYFRSQVMGEKYYNLIMQKLNRAI